VCLAPAWLIRVAEDDLWQSIKLPDAAVRALLWLLMSASFQMWVITAAVWRNHWCSNLYCPLLHYYAPAYHCHCVTSEWSVLSFLFCACEKKRVICHFANVALNSQTEEKLTVINKINCWQENPKSLLFYCGTACFTMYAVDHHCILFHKKLKCHSSVLVRSYSYNTVWHRLCSHNSRLGSVVSKLFHDCCPNARQC